MSIATKITLWISLFSGLLLAGSGTAQRLFEERQVEVQARAIATNVGRILQVSAELSQLDAEHLRLIGRSVNTGEVLAVAFYDAKAKVVAPAPLEVGDTANPKVRRVIDADRVKAEWVRRGGQSVYIHRMPLHNRGRAAGALELILDLSNTPQTAQLTGQVAVIVGVLFIGFALSVAFFSSRTIGRPIRQVMVGMDHVMRGDFSHTLPLERSDEIGGVAYRFNEMTSQLRAAQDEVTRSAKARLQLEQRLGQSEKLATVGQLSAEIAHEVGTPLNVIAARARAMEKKADRPEVVRKNARIIATQADRITKIIQQVLDVGRKKVPNRKLVDLVGVVDNTLAFLEDECRQNDIAVTRLVVPGVPAIVGDADGLQQVVLNVVLNAVQSMSDGGALSIQLAVEERRKGGLDLVAPERYVVVAIQDTGEGVPIEAREKIFEPFYSTKERGEGTGLGLTVVMGIVKEHDGWIEVDDVVPLGTIFRIYLPIGHQVRALSTLDSFTGPLPTTIDSFVGPLPSTLDEED